MTTTKATHTPGPWRTYTYTDSASARQWTVGTIGGERIADNIERGKPQDEAEANARLIAAAPQLLEALQDTLRYAEAYYRSLPDDGPEQDHMMTSVIEPARAAILAATGGAQ